MSEFQGAERDAGEGLLRRISGPPRASSHPRLCVAVFLSSFCFFLAVPLIPLYLVELGPRAALAGPTIAVSFILSAVLSPVWTRLADRFGPKPMMIRAAVLVSAAYGLSALATSVEMLFLSRCVAGVASGFVPVATAALVRLSDEERRSADMGWLSSAKSAGALLGPATGGLVVWATGSFRVAFLSAAAASLITAAIAMSMPSLSPQPSAGAEAPQSPPAARRVVVSALLLTLLLATGGMLLQLWLPFELGRARGAVNAAGLVGVILAVASGLSMFCAPLWGRLADRRRRGQVLAATIIVPLPMIIALAVIDNPGAEIVLFVCCAAFGSEALALLGGEVSRRIPQGSIGPYFGWSHTFTQTGSACAALLVPPLVAHSIAFPIWLSAALYLVSAVFVVAFVHTIRAFSVED